ncbi:phosphatase PAP2 family protein [Microbacterium sp. P05]|uniref:phosphatase PAP2 family protein n=1 Tax=Microbacterium sp. P05 TaxID=3366948 RepID=UPI003744BF8E
MTTPLFARHRRGVRVALATGLAASLCLGAAAPAFAAPNDPIAPVPDAWGRYYVDAYKTNDAKYTTPATNVAMGVLSRMLDYWQPVADPKATAQWDANGNFIPTSVGTVKNATVLDANIAEAARITQTRTEAQATDAYLVDRRNQNYSAIEGFGPWADAFRAGTNAGTTIPDTIPADATTVKYDDKGNAKGAWADTDSTYGDIVALVNQIRNSSASTNPSKAYYQYARPFRWSSDVHVLPSLIPAEKAPKEALDDGGYPSGHTNAAWLASYAFAYSTPERFQEILTSASEIGNSRIVAGMHSPADVIGGRMMSTAVAAAALNDPTNADLMARARVDGEALVATPATGSDDYANRGSNEQLYADRLTYGLPLVGDTTLPVHVPKGAEVLIETRLPYLTAEQRRWVLQSTGLESGHALLDDAEGWGRLNLFAAADGYSAFDTDVTVEMDAADGGFSAADTWRNDIEGIGSLTKAGTGSLTLTGDNSYAGGTVVTDGTLAAGSATAFGDGSLDIEDGTVSESVSAALSVGDLTVGDDGTLVLSVDGTTPALDVDGTASFDGTLQLELGDGFVPADDLVIATFDTLGAGGAFDDVQVDGLPAGYDPTIVIRDGAVHLVNANAPVAPVVGTPQISGSPVVGEPLTVAPGTWTPAPDAITYQWFRGTAPIAGATSARYTPVAADLGAVLSVEVTGLYDGGSAASARATASGPVVAAAPTASPSPSATPSATPAAVPSRSGALAATGGSPLDLALPFAALGLLGLGASFVIVRARTARSRRA